MIYIIMVLVMINLAIAAEHNDTGIEFFNDTMVWHLWNEKDDYYIDSWTGIQLTNHYEQYWSHNVFCFQTIQGGKFCADSFEWTWENSTDNTSYANLTGHTNIKVGAHDFDVTISYILYSNNKWIKIITTAKNNKKTLEGYFIWRIQDIQINMTMENDWAIIDDTNYSLHQNISLNFTNLSSKKIYLKDNISQEYLYLGWKNDNYSVIINNETGQYNAPAELWLGPYTIEEDDVVTENFFWIDAIGVDNITSGTDAGTVTLTVPHTATGTESDGILIVTVQVTDASETDRIIQSVTHNNEALTHLPADADDNIEQRTEIWYRLNPTAGGTPDIVVTARGSCTDLSLGAISLTGVNSNNAPSIIDTYHETNRNLLTQLHSGGPTNASQSFTGTGETIEHVAFLLRKINTPTGDVTYSIHAHSGTYGTSSVPTGNALASGSFDIESLTGGLVYKYITTPISFTPTEGTKYTVVVSFGGGDVTNNLAVGTDTSSPTHSGNIAEFDGSWDASSGEDAIFALLTSEANAITGDSTPPTLNITTVGDSSYVIDSLAIAESDGTKIGVQYETIHKTDVGGDTHASQYVDAGGAGIQVMNYSDTDADTSWVMSAVSIQALVEAPPSLWGCTLNTTGTSYINCSDNCNLVLTDVAQNIVYLRYTGFVQGLRNVTNSSRIRIDEGCRART